MYLSVGRITESCRDLRHQSFEDRARRDFHFNVPISEKTRGATVLLIEKQSLWLYFNILGDHPAESRTTVRKGSLLVLFLSPTLSLFI